MSQNYGGRDVRRIIKAHDKIAAMYADERFDGREGGQLRGFLVSLIWAQLVERLSGEALSDRLTSLHPSGVPGDPHWAIRRIIRSDLPRYEPPDFGWPGPGCGAPMIRREGTCGQRSTSTFRITDPLTGRWHRAGSCSRHRSWGREAHRQEILLHQAGNLPEPAPNAGGIAPSHSSANWADLYAWADPYWKPPAAGIVAADWPVIAKIHAHEKPNFALVSGEGASAVSGDRPVFELIRGGE